MRVVGHSSIALPNLMPSAAALQQAATHQATGMALMRVVTTGVRKGVYRYSSHEAANRASEDALLATIAMNQKVKQALLLLPDGVAAVA